MSLARNCRHRTKSSFWASLRNTRFANLCWRACNAWCPSSRDNITLTAQRVDALVCARRYEESDVDTWTDRWRTGACAWLPRAAIAAVQRRRMVRAWVRWLVAEVMMPLMRNHFYVTESALHRNKMFYFRKPLWRKIAKTVQLSDMYRLADEVEAQELLGNRFGLPCARLRFVPKATGMRLCVRLSICRHRAVTVPTRPTSCCVPPTKRRAGNCCRVAARRIYWARPCSTSTTSITSCYSCSC